MRVEMKIASITVLGTFGTDKICFHTELPTAFPEMKYETVLTADARAGFGLQWVEENFPGIPVKYIDTYIPVLGGKP